MTGRDRPTPLTGEIVLPGDKSISHRALILAALAPGRSRLRDINVGADVSATARALSALGARCLLDPANAIAEVEGCGWAGLAEPDDVVDVGNSGTSLRLVAGICAAVPGLSVLTGDATLRRRPMLRIAAPLRALGARVDGRDGGDRVPLVIRGGRLAGVEWTTEVPSAQVKSAVLLAGLAASGVTTVIEPFPSRDHTERMLAARGVPVERRGTAASVRGGGQLQPGDHGIPGDVSSALFPLVAAALIPGSRLTAVEVGLNPTRCGAFEVLRAMGAGLETEITGEVSGEPVGRVRVAARPLRATTVQGSAIPGLIDEIPALCIAACGAAGETVFRDATELRVKESDRIATLTEGINALGGSARALPDGLVVTGPVELHDGHVDARGDHRIALAFAVAAIAWGRNVRIAGWDSVATSFPEFHDVMAAAPRGTGMTVVAIDGPAGAGKSTIARAVADALGFVYLDTGALYRAVALAALRRGVPPDDGVSVAELVAEIDLVAQEGRVLLEGEDVSTRIRHADVTAIVSTIAAHEEVRAALIDYQREVGASSNVVMEGRDIGVTVVPDAEVKIWLTASLEERAQRRARELDETESRDLARTMAELSARDAADMRRAASPLSRPADAATVDSTGRPVEEVVEAVLRVVRRELDDRS